MKYLLTLALFLATLPAFGQGVSPNTTPERPDSLWYSGTIVPETPAPQNTTRTGYLLRGFAGYYGFWFGASYAPDATHYHDFGGLNPSQFDTPIWTFHGTTPFQFDHMYQAFKVVNGEVDYSKGHVIAGIWMINIDDRGSKAETHLFDTGRFVPLFQRYMRLYGSDESGIY